MEQTAYEEMYEQEEGHWWFRGRRDVIRALLRRARLGPSPRILDAGCGTGRNLVEFGPLGLASGVDPSDDAVAFCTQRGLPDVQRAGLESLPFGPGEFDLLFAFDVLEHVEDDAGALRELRRVAAPGAALVVTVPAHQWMWTEHDVHLHHVRRYGRRVLEARLRAAGWRLETVTYFNCFVFPLVAAARIAARWSPRRHHTDLDRTPAWLNRVLEVPMRVEAAMVAGGLGLPFGVSLGLVCRNLVPPGEPGS